MASCKKCGAELPQNAAKCPKCGAPTPAQQAKDFVNNVNNTPDYSAQFDANDIANNKVMAILAYLSWLILIPLFLAKESKFARFHVNQAIVLVIASFVLGIISGVCTAIVPILGIIFLIPELACLALMILGIVNAAQGKAKELPIVGNIRIFK